MPISKEVINQGQPGLESGQPVKLESGHRELGLIWACACFSLLRIERLKCIKPNARIEGQLLEIPRIVNKERVLVGTVYDGKGRVDSFNV